MKVQRAAWVLSVLFAVSLHAQTVVIQDGDFLSWSFSSYTAGSNAASASASMTREAAGGNPGAQLRVETTAPFPSTAFATGIKNDFTTNAPLEGVDYSLSLDVFSGPTVTGAGQAIQLLVEQNGTIYAQSLGVTGVQPSYATVTFNSTLSAGAFARVIGAGPAAPVFDGSVATRFGFSAGNSDIVGTFTQFYDNYQLTFTETDLLMTKTESGSTALAGESFAYTIEVDNLGPANAANLVITDTIPVGTTFAASSSEASSCNFDNGTRTLTCTLATLVAGADEVITLTLNVDPTVANNTILSNTAAVTTTTAQTNLANDTDTETTTVNAEADLSITKTTPQTTIDPGGTITYTITVNNAGPSAGTNVVMNDAVPADTTFVSITEPAGFDCTTPAVGGTGPISCTAATFAPAAQAVFTLVVQVSGNATGTILNSASVTSPALDPTANNAATATTTVNAVAEAIPSVTELGLLMIAMALAAAAVIRLRI